MDTRELKSAAREAQEQRKQIHPWSDQVALWLEEQRKDHEAQGKGLEMFVTTREIYVGALGGHALRMNIRDARQIGAILRAHGWRTGWSQRSGRTERGFWSAEKRRVEQPKPAGPSIADVFR